MFRAFTLGFALLLAAAPLTAQSPLSNKKFIAGLMATNPMNLASVRIDATAGTARYAIAINYGLGAHQRGPEARPLD